MQVAILAGGLATRLRPLTEEMPKSLIRIQGRPFLEYQLEFLNRGGVEDIVLCVGYLGEQIERYFGNGNRFGVRIRYSHEGDSLLGTAGALKKSEGLLEDPFFAMYGDSYLLLNFSKVMSFFKSQDKLALMTAYKNYDRYDRSNTSIEGNLVKQYSKRAKAEGMVYIDYGANIFRKRALELIPENQPYALEDLFPKLIEKKELLAYETEQRFFQIGSPDGLEEFKVHISSGGFERLTC